MFTISESALRAFISDVCQLANEDPLGKNTHYICAIRDIIEKTGVGADPLATEDENFLEYMTALSMGVTRLFRTEKRYRLSYIRSAQQKIGLPPLVFNPPSVITWIVSDLDQIGDDLFKGEESIAYHVHRPLLSVDAAEAADDDCVAPTLYTSGDMDNPTVFKSVGKRLPSITGRKLPFKSLIFSCNRGNPAICLRRRALLPQERFIPSLLAVLFRSEFQGTITRLTKLHRVLQRSPLLSIRTSPKLTVISIPLELPRVLPLIRVVFDRGKIASRVLI